MLYIIIIAVQLPNSHLASTAPNAVIQSTRTVWRVACIDDARKNSGNMGDHAAVYDSAGMLHVA